MSAVRTRASGEECAATPTFDKIGSDLGADAERSMAMLDGKTPTLTGPGERTLAGGGPRLLNAAAWLEALAALEAEFKTILDQDAPKITRFSRRQRQD
jgi:hypothetical protein